MAFYNKIKKVGFRGTYPSFEELPAHGNPGDVVDVDAGVGSDVVRYLWDKNDNQWVQQGSSGGSASTDERVKASAGDPAAGFLDEKVDNTTVVVQANQLKVKDGVFLPTSHASDTEVHGAQGAVVGTQNIQTLSNKTLDETNKVGFDITRTGGVNEGEFAWDEDKENFIFGVDGSSIELNTPFFIVRNNSGAQITKGTPVMATGTLGTSSRITVDKYVTSSSVDSNYLLGFAQHDIPNDTDGIAITSGKIRGYNTSAWAEGAILYTNPSVPGTYTTTEPEAPNPKLAVAFVINSHATNGTIAVRWTKSTNIGEDQLVQLGTLASKDVLVYNDVNERFENRQLVASDISDFDTEVSNNPTVEANTNARHSHANKTVLDGTQESYLTTHKNKLDNISVTQTVDLDQIETDTNTNNDKVSADGSIDTHSDVDTAGKQDGDVLGWNNTNSAWEPTELEVAAIGNFSLTKTYNTNDLVAHNGAVYKSTQDTNLGNDPETTGLDPVGNLVGTVNNSANKYIANYYWQQLQWNGDGTILYGDKGSNTTWYKMIATTPYSVATLGAPTTFTGFDKRFFNFIDGGSKVFSTYSTSCRVDSLSVPYDLESVITSHSSNASVGSYYGGQLSENGEHLLIKVSTTQMNYYQLSTPFDVSTASLVSSNTIAGGYGFQIDRCGRHLYTGADIYIYEYELSTPFDVSTAILLGTVTPGGVGRDEIKAIFFQKDGTGGFFYGDEDYVVELPYISEYEMPCSKWQKITN